uniref:uncharacterized protein LOC120341767 n=1 Tax=Styela clava TaxID=7725 RepID=UPI001939F70E|nr:uncharacterized protein LOC120341767 [Styela clava]
MVLGCDVCYRGNCFKIPEELHNSPEVTFAQAEQLCRDIGWKLANIYSLEHYQSVAAYLRTKIPSFSNYATVWLGMTRNQQTQTVYLSDGTVAPTLPWYPSYPHSTSSTKMNMDIKSDERSLNQGMVNYSSTETRSGALCQI